MTKINTTQIKTFQNFFFKCDNKKNLIKISEHQTDVLNKPKIIAEYFTLQEKKAIRTGRKTVRKEIYNLKDIFEILKVKKIKNICDLRYCSSINNINEQELAKFLKLTL